MPILNLTCHQQVKTELCDRYKLDKGEFHFALKTAIMEGNLHLRELKIKDKAILLILTMSKLKRSLCSND